MVILIFFVIQMSVFCLVDAILGRFVSCSLCPKLRTTPALDITDDMVQLEFFIQCKYIHVNSSVHKM